MSAWTVVVPIKPWDLAKTRLALPSGQRIAVARAMALDTLEVVSRTPGVDQVVVVSSRAEVRQVGRAFGAVALADRGMAALDPLNDAIGKARGWAIIHRPQAPFAVVPADLAALTPASLRSALGLLARQLPAFVPDAEGTGTTVYAAATPAAVETAYGPHSASRHEARVVTPIREADVRVRRDVDTLDDLAHAARLGLGPYVTDLVSQGRRDQAIRPVV